MQIFTLILGNTLYNSFPVLNHLFEFIKPAWTFLCFPLVQVTITPFTSLITAFHFPVWLLEEGCLIWFFLTIDIIQKEVKGECAQYQFTFIVLIYLQLSWEGSTWFKWAFGPNSKVVTCGIWSNFRRQIYKRLRMCVFVCRLLKQ